MEPIIAIARTTFLEARRNRVTWSIVLFCLVIVLASFLSQQVTIYAFDRILRDVGLATIHIFGVILAIFLGVSGVTREIERRNVYLIVSKPISRTQYLIGKILGVWLTLIVSLGLMWIAFLLELHVFRSPISPILFEAFWLILVELLVIASFSVLASSFTSSIMSAFMSVGLFVVGHTAEDIAFYTRNADSLLVRKVGEWTFYVVPNLDRLNLKTAASTLTAVHANAVLISTAYGISYAAAFIILAAGLFSRRDLK